MARDVYLIVGEMPYYICSDSYSRLRPVRKRGFALLCRVRRFSTGVHMRKGEVVDGASLP